MIRLILAGLAVTLAVLAFATGQSWLYATAGGTGGVALGLVVYQLWMRGDALPGTPGSSADTDDDLGISAVRPMAPANPDAPKQASSTNGTAPEPSETASGTASDASSDTSPATASDTPSRTSANRDAPSPSDADSASETKEAEAAPRSGAQQVSAARSQASPSPAQQGASPPQEEGDPRVAAFVRALRHSLQAHTVALLVQEEMALEYRIAGLDSAAHQVKRSGSFSAPVPLVTARMSHADVTVRSLSDEPRLREALNYYPNAVPGALQHVAVAPVHHAQQSATYFLLADGSAEVPFPHQHTKRLLAQGASMLGHLLGYDPESLGPSIADTSRASNENEMEESASDEVVDMTTPSPDVERQGPRPRIEIVAEEMERAYAENAPLALALVHLNRADMLAEQGQDAVDDAEAALRDTLQEAAPQQRVERFGELTYGVFHRAHVDVVEEWTLTVHRGMLRASGLLKGGVSIGVAMMAARHKTANDFRGDGMEALKEAYQSGAPVIID